jgi:hypothetical protein
MKLSFLGQAYNASSPAIDALETGNTVTFLGKTAKAKAYHVPQRQSAGYELAFLGRRYTR